jgi:hypothetical protein
MAAPTPKKLAVDLLQIISDDEARLDRIDKYAEGIQDEPYMPANADSEYLLLAKRSITNMMPLVLASPAQALYVDSFLPSRQVGPKEGRTTPEWKHWQRSGLDARQLAIHRGALTYGHSFTVTEKKGSRIITRGLSPLRTSALFRDAANDINPYAALTITTYPDGEEKGEATLWDEKKVYPVTFESLTDEKSVKVGDGKVHGLDENPVTRFAASVDLEGRTTGVVEPLIPVQNRLNQTVFDLLLAQTYTSQEVRAVSGMAPPMRDVWYFNDHRADSAPTLDEDGQAPAGWELRTEPIPMNHNASRFLFAEDSEARFTSLPGGELGGLISSIEMSIRHISALSQTPAHFVLGQIANLSAEALQAAETALSRKVDEYRSSFGESWERVFRLAGGLSGDAAMADDFEGEVVWRDVEARSLAAIADALGKLRQNVDAPARGLWEMIPGITQTQLTRWEELREEEDHEAQQANALERATRNIGGLPGSTSTDARPVTEDPAA